MRDDCFAIMKNQDPHATKQKCSNDMVSLNFMQSCELAYYRYIKLYDICVYIYVIYLRNITYAKNRWVPTTLRKFG